MKSNKSENKLSIIDKQSPYSISVLKLCKDLELPPSVPVMQGELAFVTDTEAVFFYSSKPLDIFSNLFLA
jgi:hypothetical protein